MQPRIAHEPVLVEEVIELLAPERGGLYVDCTLGLGGHAEALLARAEGARLIGIDRDPVALELAAERLERFADRLTLVEGDFGDLAELGGELGIRGVDGLLADLGVSSLQLEIGARGFSFRREGPLDMRMGGGSLTARDVVNRYSEAELERIIRSYGEERQARRIARAIVEARRQQTIDSTLELRDIVHSVKGRPRRGGRIDSATRTFQALRIEVNRELEALEDLLDQAVGLLNQDGRLVVISYHSLEDRIVKNTLKDLARGHIDEVTGRPQSETRVIELLTGKPVRPTAEEVMANRRARSARMRAARRI